MKLSKKCREFNLFSKVFLLIFMVFLIDYTLTDTDSCPTGMRKTYVEYANTYDFGAARTRPLAIAFYKGTGALWIYRQILLEPRMEVHLKVKTVDFSSTQSSELQQIEGFTITLSKTKNKVNTDEWSMGYSGFYNSYIAEFDFYKTGNDYSDHSLSIHKCFGTQTCKVTEDSTTKQTNTITSFIPGRNNTFDFVLSYSDHVVTIKDGETSIFSEGINLEDKFGDTIAYLGFTGGIRGNRNELDIAGSFFCEDNYDLQKMTGFFWIGDQQLDTATLKAGTQFKYLFTFINNQGNFVPHCYDQHIWSYSFLLKIDCGFNDAYFTTKDKYGIFLNMVCTKVGRHNVGVYEDSKGNGPISYYYIIPDDLAYIYLVGHDNVLQNVPQETDSSDSNYHYLKFGTAKDKNFIISDSKEIVLELNLTDKYGNPVDFQEDDSATLLSKSQLSLLSTNGATLTMKKNGDHFQLIVNVAKPGTYRVKKNKFMDYGYTLHVYPGAPSEKMSQCSIKGYSSSPTIDEGQSLTYTCNIKDIQGNELNTQVMKTIYDYGFSCEAVRSVPSSLSFDLSPVDKSTYFDCPMTPNLMGDHVFNGYFYKTSSPSNKKKINSGVNSFIVLPIPINLNGAKAYQLSSGNWFLEKNANFPYEENAGGFITALDLTDRDGKTLISTYGKYSPNFDIKTMQALLTSPHDPDFKFKDLILTWYYIGGKPYIGVYTKGYQNTNGWITKSSYDYIIVTLLKESEFDVILKYQLIPSLIGTYTTCFHPLDESSTIVNYEFNGDDGKSFKMSPGKQINLGTLALQTIDKNLYNYDIGAENIRVSTTPASSYLKFEIKKQTIPGTYNVACTSTGSGETEIQIYVNDVPVGPKAKVIVETGNCYYIEVLNTENYDSFSKYSYKYPVTVDDSLSHKFRLKDKYGNYITKGEDVGLSISGSHEGSLITDKSSYSVSFTNNIHQLDDKNNLLGKYVWSVSCSESGEKVQFMYSRGAGQIDLKKSFMILHANEIHIGETSYSEVTLLDKFGNNIGKTSGRLEEAKKYITVIGKDAKNKEFVYDFDQITPTMTLRYKITINEENIITVTAKYNSDKIPCEKPVLKITYEAIDVNNNQLFALLDTSVAMSPSTTLTVKNAVQVPVYKLLFYNSDKERIYDYNKDTEITCLMQSEKTSNTWDLIVSKESDYVLLKHTDTDTKEFSHFPTGNYFLKLTIGGKTVTYPLYLLGEKGSEDASELTEWESCYPDKIEIEGIAGVEYSGNLEFRCSDGLRWNFKGDTSKFVFMNSYGLKNNELQMKFDYGGKKGQFMFTISQTKVTTKGQSNIISLLYEGKEINTKVYLTIKNAALHHLTYIDGLRDGTVIDLPTLLFRAEDKYGNEYTELLEANQKTLNSLTSGATSNQVDIVSNNFVDKSKDSYLHVQYQVKKVTVITVTSNYFVNEGEEYKYVIKSGPIDASNTRVEFGQGPYVIPNSKVNYTITPQDLYGNPVDTLNDNDLKDFDITYTNDKNPNKPITVDPTQDCTVNKKALVIECVTFINEAGVNTFDVDYKKEDVQCTGSCSVTISPGEIDFSKTSTYYTNGKKWLVTDALNNGLCLDSSHFCPELPQLMELVNFQYSS